MKQLIIHTVIFAFFLSTFLACEYEPTSENFLELSKPDTTKMIQVNLSPFETQYVFTKFASVNYNLNTFGLKVYNVEFFVGDVSIHTANEARGSFGFQPSLYGRGTKTMSMKVTTNTNTGSLADLLGGEALVYQQNWDVILDGEAPNPVEITKMVNENGVLKLEWEKYTRINFEKYILYRKFGKIEDFSQFKAIASFTDPKQTSFYDYAYIGDNSTYWLVVEGSEQSSIGGKKEIYFAPPKLDTLWVRSDSTCFVWRKNQFHKAFKEVKLTLLDRNGRTLSNLFSSENLNDTSVIVKKLTFGTPMNYNLSSYAKTEISVVDNKQILQSNILINLGLPFPAFDEIICPPDKNYAFIYKRDYQLSKVDLTTKSIVSTVTCSIPVYWFISNFNGDLYTYNNYSLTQYDKMNLTINKRITSYDLGFDEFFNPIEFAARSSLSISPNNQIAGKIGLGVGIYDLTTKKMVFNDQKTKIEFVVFSPDGNYCYDISFWGSKKAITLYKVTATGLEKTAQLPGDTYGKTVWIPGKDHKLLVLKGEEINRTSSQGDNSISIWDPQTGLKDVEFPVKIGSVTSIDHTTGHVAICNEANLITQNKSLYIYNFETGKLIKEMNISYFVGGLVISKSMLFSSIGYVFKYTN